MIVSGDKPTEISVLYFYPSIYILVIISIHEFLNLVLSVVTAKLSSP